jgi:hypothetical protein
MANLRQTLDLTPGQPDMTDAPWRGGADSNKGRRKGKDGKQTRREIGKKMRGVRRWRTAAESESTGAHAGGKSETCPGKKEDTGLSSRCLPEGRKCAVTQVFYVIQFIVSDPCPSNTFCPKR